ncbi:hypothetical protein HDU91_005780, partial [Kappamyces sp. JEL0680]
MLITLIGTVIQFLHWYGDAPAVVAWLLVVLTVGICLVTVLGQMELLESFCVLSHWIQPERVARWKKWVVVWFVVLNAGVWTYLPYIGRTPPPVLYMLFICGYPLFIFGCLGYDTWQNVYITTKLVSHLRMREAIRLRDSDPHGEQPQPRATGPSTISSLWRPKPSQDDHRSRALTRFIIVSFLFVLWDVLTV